VTWSEDRDATPDADSIALARAVDAALFDRVYGWYWTAVRSDQIVASDPRDKDMYFDPAEDKVYRHPTFYELPKSVDHM